MKSIVILIFCGVCCFAQALGGEEEPKTAADILAALESTNYQTRRKAVLATHGRRESALLDRLIEMARSDPHPNIRAYVADALATHRDERVFPLLVEMIDGETMPGPRQHALAALGCTGYPAARPILRKKLESNQDRAWAARGLGNLGDPEDYLTLERLYRDLFNDPWVSDFASEAMMKIDPQAAITVFLELFPKLDGGARFGVVNILREHPIDRVREAMTNHLDAEDRGIHLAAVRALGRVGNEATAKRLLAFLDRAPEERGPVASALGEIAAPFTARPIADALHKEENGVTAVVMMRALVNIGDRRAIATLIPFLDHDGTTPQPTRISSIRTFPWNLHVKDAALWAILTLRDGKPPCEPGDLSSFPLGKRKPRCEREDSLLRKWWKENGADGAFTFGD